MKKRKTRKEKIRSQQRSKNELQSLKLQECDLNGKITRIKKDNKKNIFIRNFKYFKTFNGYLFPYVIISTLTTCSFSLFGGGYPFIKDNNEKYKHYSIESDYEGELLYKESFEENTIFDSSPDNVQLKVYFPWKKIDDETYQRRIREYDVYGTKELIDAILEEDFVYMNDMLNDYKEQIETKKGVEVEEQGHIECSIFAIDFTEKIYIPETDDKNIRITLIEILINIIIGIVVNCARGYDLSKKFKDIQMNYPIKNTAELENKLDEVKKKILSYRNGGVR